MKEINERPICHRAEDLVTYLYGEANEANARDFATHAEACDSCGAELAAFQQVHESILIWRNEALGSAFNAATEPAAVFAGAAPDSNQAMQRRKLSAWGALREFFDVSPLWLRGATAFAALMLCVLAALVISGSWSKLPPPAGIQSESGAYNKQQFEAAVANEVKRQMEELNSQHASSRSDTATTVSNPDEKIRPPQLAVNRTPARAARQRGLTRQEREQLAADLRLIPRDEDELPFVFSDEPNQ
jgi:hypothetical protein